MDMNELHSPGTEPAPWLPILRLGHKAYPGNRVPGSKGTECSALDEPSKFHARLDVKLAPFLK